MKAEQFVYGDPASGRDVAAKACPEAGWSEPSSSPIKALFAGGGSGGHLFPGLEVATVLREGNPNAEVLFVGTKKDMEDKILRKLGIPRERLPAPKLPRSLGGAVSFPIRLLRALWRSIGTVRAFAPDVIVGLGGYGAFGPSMAGVLMGIPLILMEQNVIPGKTNRLLSRFAKIVCGQWPGSENRFPRPERVVITGNPVRREIFMADKLKARRVFSLENKERVLLVMGGSQGAQGLNAVVEENLNLMEYLRSSLGVIHLSGERDVERLQEAYAKRRLDAVVLAFLKEIWLAYAAADLAVCRAGGTTIAELSAMGLPAILVPYPYATDGHQRKNAEELDRAGAAIKVEQDSFSPEAFLEILDLILDTERIRTMGHRMARFSKPQASFRVVKRIMELAAARRQLQFQRAG
jgi:UDP-N-acetylglucosamine--N-acetylmuramyl-(pentapeptide) pyrophosphoryl-undecaprenol N-acetylglucosamine transferase